MLDELEDYEFSSLIIELDYLRSKLVKLKLAVNLRGGSKKMEN